MDTKKGDTYYRLRFSEILSKEKLLSNVDLFKIMQAQREGNLESLGQIAVKKGILTEDQLSEVYKKYFTIARVSLDNRKIPEEVAYLVPVVLLRKYLVFPLQFTSSNKLAVAMVNPLDIQAIKHLEVLTHHPIKPLYCSESEILKKIAQFFEKNIEPGVEVLQEDRVVALKPEDAIVFFKSQERKKSTPPVKKELASTPPPEVNSSDVIEDEEIIEVNPIPPPSPVAQVNTSPGATTFWGNSSGKSKIDAPASSAPLSVKPLLFEQTGKMKIVETDQPLQNKMAPQTKTIPALDLRQPVLTPTKKLKSMAGKESEKKTEDLSASKTYKLKPMQMASGTENIIPKELKPTSKKLEETNRLSKEATQKLAELTEQIQELEPKQKTILSDATRNDSIRRKLKRVERPNLFAPIPIPVLSMSAVDFYKKSESTPKSFLDEKVQGWTSPHQTMPADSVTAEEFYLLER